MNDMVPGAKLDEPMKVNKATGSFHVAGSPKSSPREVDHLVLRQCKSTGNVDHVTAKEANCLDCSSKVVSVLCCSIRASLEVLQKGKQQPAKWTLSEIWTSKWRCVNFECVY